ncbi:protein Cep78 homolog isoform X7 [Drosophila pseudoobscura]|uniref:Protein Cep78 homolog isoform X7 n=1 Tax=Drosophila pseudoobscura pseudoobscura TaxID=46245 RepID=A0A6I8W3E3_DROPS|nr:protein Cep78 homolog isoform X7 [Drosophila pseudoobscura]
MSLGRVSGIRNGMMRELAKKVTVPKLVKKSSKSRSFHFRYLELCRNKNLTPLPEIRKKSNETTLLELYADKLTVSDWLLIIEAIHHDLTLKTFVLRMRRTYQHNTIDPIDTENRARRFTQRPVIFTRFIFRALVQAISNCVLSNKNLTVVKLEGLPLYEGYIEGITKSLSGNDRLETLSFRKSTLGDKGCQLVCNTAKYLNRITIVDLSECNITCQGAVYVAEMIKIQKISRFTEGWEKSLRYQTPDMNSLLGLRTVLLANNPNIGDKGLSCIVDVLKEDAWIRVVDMQGCGLTDVGANDILSLLDLNTFIKEFHVRNNVGISQALQRTIHERLLPPEIEHKQEDEFDSNFLRDTENGKYPQGKKATIVKLLSHAKAVEDKLAFERVLRQKAEDLNFKLTKQLMYKDSQMADDNVSQRPDTPKDHMQMKKDVKVSPTPRQMRKTNEYIEMKEDFQESPTHRQMRKTKEYMEMEEDVPESPTYRQMRKTKEYMEMKEDVPESPRYRQMRKTKEYMEMKEDVPESPRYRQMRKTKEYMEMKEDVPESPTYRQMRKTKEYMEKKEDVPESPTYRQMRKTNEYLEMEEDVPESPKYRQMRKTNEYLEMEEDVPESPKYRQMRKNKEYMEMKEDVRESPQYRQMRKTNEYLEMEGDVPESPKYRQMRKTKEYMEMKEDVRESPKYRQMRKTNEYLEMEEDVPESPQYRQMRKTNEYLEMEGDVPESPKYRQMRKTKEYMEMKEDVRESPKYRQMRKTNEYLEMEEDVPESPKYRQMRKTNEYQEMEEDVPESPTYRQMRKTNEYLEMEEDVPESPKYRQMRKTNEYLEMEEDVPESPTYRQMRQTNEYLEMEEEYLSGSSTYCATLVGSSMTTPELTPRSDAKTLCPYDESEDTDSRSQGMDPMEFSHLDVRKVRSEMKYVESNVNEGKKNRESKSDHEFANELHFKLNSMVHFERDIGDSAKVSAKQAHRYEDAGDEQDIGPTSMIQDGSKQVVEQINLPTKKKTGVVKAGQKQRRARNDGGGDGQCNSVEQSEHHIGPTVMIKDGQTQEQDRNDGGGDGKRSKVAKQRRRAKMPDSIG